MEKYKNIIPGVYLAFLCGAWYYQDSIPDRVPPPKPAEAPSLHCAPVHCQLREQPESAKRNGVGTWLFNLDHRQRSRS